MTPRLAPLLALALCACHSVQPAPAQLPPSEANTGAVATAAVPTNGAADTTAAPTAPPAQPTEEPATEQDIAFDATVEKISLLSMESGKAWPVGIDPRYLLVVRVHHVAPVLSNEPSGSVPVAGQSFRFAIHSPARVFAEAHASTAMTSKRVHFVVSRQRRGTVVSFWGLRREP